MGRGCTPADVLEALYYVVAPAVRNGPGHSGHRRQVMLKYGVESDRNGVGQRPIPATEHAIQSSTPAGPSTTREARPRPAPQILGRWKR